MRACLPVDPAVNHAQEHFCLDQGAVGLINQSRRENDSAAILKDLIEGILEILVEAGRAAIDFHPVIGEQGLHPGADQFVGQDAQPLFRMDRINDFSLAGGPENEVLPGRLIRGKKESIRVEVANHAGQGFLEF